MRARLARVRLRRDLADDSKQLVVVAGVRRDLGETGQGVLEQRVLRTLSDDLHVVVLGRVVHLQRVERLGQVVLDGGVFRGVGVLFEELEEAVRRGAVLLRLEVADVRFKVAGSGRGGLFSEEIATEVFRIGELVFGGRCVGERVVVLRGGCGSGRFGALELLGLGEHLGGGTALSEALEVARRELRATRRDGVDDDAGGDVVVHHVHDVVAGQARPSGRGSEQRKTERERALADVRDHSTLLPKKMEAPSINVRLFLSSSFVDSRTPM